MASIILSARETTLRESTFPAPSSDFSIVPNITSTVSHLSRTLDHLVQTMTAFCTRVTDLERAARSFSSPTHQDLGDTSHLSDLLVETGRLHRLMDSGITALREEIRGSYDAIAVEI